MLEVGRGFPITNASINNIASILKQEGFVRWGYHSTIVSYNASQFLWQQWRTRCAKWGAKVWTSPPYTARANPTERRNYEIKKGLRLRLCGQRNHANTGIHPGNSVELTLKKERHHRIFAEGVTPGAYYPSTGAKRGGGAGGRLYDPQLYEKIQRAREAQDKYGSPRPEIDADAIRLGERLFMRSLITLLKASKNYTRLV